jgi:1-acylglycerone phosphate reductase
MSSITASNQKRRTVLITGCSDGGLGCALAIEFHKDTSIRVFATARNLTKVSRLASLGIETLALDVLDPASINACVAEVSKLTNGSLDILLNNAGAGYSMPLMDISLPAAQSLFNLNVWSYITVSQAFLPLLLSSAAHEGRYQPIIVNNTSVVSIVPGPHIGVYHASKAASAMLTDTLRLEMKPFGIRVVELKTGGVHSNFFENLKADVNAAPKLPERSIYAPAKEEIEWCMRGENLTRVMVEAEGWAKQVVSSLVKRKPKAVIWAGGGAWTGRLLTILPIPHTALDWQFMKMGKLDVLERRLKEQKGKRNNNGTNVSGGSADI